MTTEDTPFQIGKAQIYFKSKIKNPAFAKTSAGMSAGRQKSEMNVGIIATGALLHRALKVAKELDAAGTNVTVMNLSTIKPLDEDAIIRLAHDTGALVTVEEHQIRGGMGSAVAECMAKHYPVPIEFIGVLDQFGQSGKPDELIELYGMGEKHIHEAVSRVLLRKK
jgi:transketolase